MRLFVEVPLPEELKERLGKLGREIEQEGIKLVKPENMHATLKFLGEVPEGKLADIKERLGRIKFGSFSCSMKGVGVFPDESYIRVVWTGLESGGRLDELAKDVIGSLSGYGKDNRFSAHITIARVKKKVDLKTFLDKYRKDEFGSFTVNSFNLMQSVLSREGPEYTVLASFRAVDDA
jgi:2'-5' RNA ligase